MTSLLTDVPSGDFSVLLFPPKETLDDLEPGSGSSDIFCKTVTICWINLRLEQITVHFMAFNRPYLLQCCPRLPSNRIHNHYICPLFIFCMAVILHRIPWWRHQIETFSALLALCAGNSLVTGEFPAQRPVTQNFDVFFDMCLNKRLSINRDSGDLRRHSAQYDVTVMSMIHLPIRFMVATLPLGQFNDCPNTIKISLLLLTMFVRC